MNKNSEQLLIVITTFIATAILTICIVFFSRERIEPKEVVVNEDFSYIVMKDVVQEKLAREIFNEIENNLTKEGVDLKLKHSMIQELSPVSDEYKGLSDEIKDSISLYNIFNKDSNMASCLKERLNSYRCKDGIKRIVNLFKEKYEERISEAENKIISMTPDIVDDGKGNLFVGLENKNLRANASTVLKYVKEQIDKKESGCYEDAYRTYIMTFPTRYIQDKISSSGWSDAESRVSHGSRSREESYEAILTVSIFNEGKICIHDLESPKCDIFIDKLLKDMDKVCSKARLAREKKQKEKERAQKEKERMDVINQEKRENFLKSRGINYSVVNY